MIDEQRSPRDPLMGEVWRDYGYANARDMAVRRRVTVRVWQASGKDQRAEATDEALTVVVPRATQANT